MYHCFKCGISGLLLEFQRRPEPSRGRKTRGRYVPPEGPPPEIPDEYVAGCRRDFPGSPADDYERSRGIDGVKTGMGFDPSYPFLIGDEWVNEPAVVFFFQDLEGRVVAKQGRMLRAAGSEDTAKITFGKISHGVFNVHVLSGEEVIVCEGPNTAAALVERGYPAIALGGKTTQDWLIEALAERRVWIGLDNDEPGRKAATELLEVLRSVGCEAELLLPPEEGQDWNDVLRENPSFRVPWVCPIPYEPTLEDVRAQCRRMLRHTSGEARDMLAEWEFALESGFKPARAWWRRYGKRLRTLL
ncbi:DnaB domain protein helicase [Fimbriimonas ginsengisoli Gsoil 348]|uniref:DnaB domain protein helicase n=1 Tax=Fimbriimonas ginsengisoli Gsoil 348 TaxID=661478 RepID=A0A068NTX2_FIMGI|nr:DnaB domain protein helicase [Fimbriimonas ginsengisoli Gsoil 348]